MEMMVVSAITADAAYQVTGEGYAPEGDIRKDGKLTGRDAVLEMMGRVALLCNDAELFQQEGTWKVEGDPTEGALYPFANKLGMTRQVEQAMYPRLDAIPFEIGAPVHGDAQPGCRWRAAVVGEGGTRSHP
jgi:magnesium-transporting ATPase (P-type)